MSIHLVYTDRDWLKDASHENGQYHNTCVYCKNSFIGYKRRIVCKLCNDVKTKEWEALSKEKQDEIIRNNVEEYKKKFNL